jgi:hypothetical protein
MSRLNNSIELRRISDKIIAAVNEVLKEEGMTAQRAKTVYETSGLSATFGVKVSLTEVRNAFGTATSIEDEKRRIEQRERSTFSALARDYGLDPNDYGRRFFSNGYWFTLTGIQPSRPKYPINAKRDADGRGFKFPAISVRVALAGAKKAA